jgi:hypothetical protein
MEKVVFSKDQNVADCEDSDSSDKENTDIKRRNVSPWEVVQTFANKPEGEQFLKSDWVYYTKYNTNHGVISVYKCRVYERFAPGYPSTNNGLESTNSWIKKHGTFRQKLPMVQLLAFLLQQANQWSKERNPEAINHKIVSKSPSLDLRLQTSAHNWIISEPDLWRRKNKYFIRPSHIFKVRNNDIADYTRMRENLSWKKFDTYVSKINQLWVLDYNSNDWIKSTCTCPFHAKNYICKHVLGIAIHQKDFIFRPETKNIPFGEKRKRGRPKLAKKALIVM